MNSLYSRSIVALKGLLPAAAIAAGFALYQATLPVVPQASTGVGDLSIPCQASADPLPEIITISDIVFHAPIRKIAPKKHTCGAVARPLVQGSGTVAFAGDWGCP